MIKKNVLTQYLLPHHFISWCLGQFVTQKFRPLVNWQINKFIRTYGVNIHDAEKTNVSDYKTFNEFFTRRLRPELRPIDTQPDSIISPADGFISEFGNINKQTLIQAKGLNYTTSALLASSKLADTFYDGQFMTIYLSPKDYHRVHMPFTGKLIQTTYVPGRLFSVNPKTTAMIPNIFTRNERLICLFETRFGPMAVILVGAMLVNGIYTHWAGKVTPFRKLTTQLFEKNKIINKGAEIGYFEFGSTVIVLLPKDSGNWIKNERNGQFIKMGQVIAMQNHLP